MMAPPRYQCLNASKQIVKNGLSTRAAFSTSRVSRSDEPPSRSATSDLLDIFPRSSPKPVDSRSEAQPQSQARPAFSNPIQTQAQRQQRNSGNAQLLGLFQRSADRRQHLEGSRVRGATTVEEMQNRNLAQDLSKQISRRWRAGDIYAPHDLSEVEMAKWKKRSQPHHDVFDVLNLNPEEHYRNFSIISEYMTPMGRIKHSKETGLRPVNQRRIARAIRRAVGIGMHPSVHRHPEIIYKTNERNESNSPFRALPGPM
ncbi:ribosomal protein S18 [Rhexocercosporidium sp. MPI-PUGE-AT-0058]|nr:ribosomal protein S18 [Rhexocercosporidium sp. MPI-PUGE-AT-0058]